MNDLLDSTVAQAHDCAYLPVAQFTVGGTDSRVSVLPSGVVSGDDFRQLASVVGSHERKCTERLTRYGTAYIFLYMEMKEARRIARAHNNGSHILPGLAIHSLSAADVLALHTELPALRRRGTDSDYNCCDLCGKTNLKHTVVFSPRDGGEDVHYGTDCADAYEFAQGRKMAA